MIFPLMTDLSWLLILLFEFELFLIFIMFFYYFKIIHLSISFGVVLTFIYLFYFIAPILQLIDSPYFLVNTLPFNENNVIHTIFLVNTFILSFFITYINVSRLKKNKLVIKNFSEIFNNVENNRDNKFLLNVLIFISVLAAISAFYETISSIENLDLFSSDEQNIFITVKGKVFYMLPYTSIMYFILIYKNKMQLKHKFLLTFLMLLLLISKNVIIDRRNALGPVYITLIMFFFPLMFTTNYRLLKNWLFVLVVLFPISSILTHVSFNDYSLDKLQPTSLIFDHFIDVHYDAWANISAGIDYVEKNSFRYGQQLVGSIGFWIPRQFWLTKPISTGQFIGDYLTTTQSMWFNNLSATIVLEGYIDFGIIGVVLYGFLLAILVLKFDLLICSKFYYYKIFGLYASLFLFFVLRGALLPSVAYLTGAYFAIVLLPKSILLLKKFFF